MIYNDKWYRFWSIETLSQEFRCIWKFSIQLESYMHAETPLNISFCSSLIVGVMWQHVCHFIRANDSQSTTATLINIIKDRFIHFLKMRSLCLFYMICLPRPTFPNHLGDNIIVKELKKSINSLNLSSNITPKRLHFGIHIL